MNPFTTARPALFLALAAGTAAAAPAPSATTFSPVESSIADPGQRPLMRAIDNLASRAQDPQRERLSILARIQASPACYAPDLPEAEYEELLRRTQLLPAGMQPGQDLRFFTD